MICGKRGDSRGDDADRPVQPDWPDTAWLRDRIADGDFDALGVAFDQYGVLVYELAGRCCAHHREHAEDLTRATFLDLWMRPWQRPRWPLPATLVAGLVEQIVATPRIDT